MSAARIRRFAPILLVTGSVLLGCLVAELGLRLAGDEPADFNPFGKTADDVWSRRDPALGWINKAGVSRSLEAGHANMSFDEIGRRVSVPAPDVNATRRVWLLGCSIVQGYGVEDAD